MSSVEKRLAELEARVTALEAAASPTKPTAAAPAAKAPRKPNLAAQKNAAWTKFAMETFKPEYDPFLASLTEEEKLDKNGKPKGTMILHNNFAKVMKEKHSTDYATWDTTTSVPAVVEEEEEEEKETPVAVPVAATAAATAEAGPKPKAAGRPKVNKTAKTN